MAEIDCIVRKIRLPEQYLAGEEKYYDVFMYQGVMAAVLPQDAEAYAERAVEIDGEGLVLMPSFTDTHTHMREPGFEWKEDIASGLSAAARGGFANIMCMANTSPVNDHEAVTSLMLKKAKEAHPNGPRLFPIGALSKELKGKELAPMSELAEAGCVAFSNDGMPVDNTQIFRNGMEYASDIDRIVIDHCEDSSMGLGAGINEGEMSSKLGLTAQPDIAEAIHIGRDILLSEYLNLPIHLAHVSCKKGIDLIRDAKKRGVNVTAETCPHYLLFTEQEVDGFNTAAKVNPPLRVEEDVKAVIEALNDGTIDMLCTDHAPHAKHEKEVEFDLAPCGISGLDTAFSATWGLVEDGVLTFDAFAASWVYNPAERFNLPVNKFDKDSPADFFLFDPKEEWVVTEEIMASKGKNTPLLGKTLKGVIKKHFINGVDVLADEVADDVVEADAE
ncbi:MAG: dihydroorotase [Desulfovibrio sp.]